MSVVLPLVLSLLAAEPAEPTAEPAAPAIPSSDAPLRVLWQPMGGDAADADRGIAGTAALQHLHRFGRLKITAAKDDGGCVLAEDRVGCLQGLVASANVDLVIAASATTSAGELVVSVEAIGASGVVAAAKGDASRMDGSFVDAAHAAVNALADSLDDSNEFHWVLDAPVMRGSTADVAGTPAAPVSSGMALPTSSLRQGLTYGGVAGVGVGVVAIVAGAIPGIAARQSEAGLTPLRLRYVDGDAAALEEAKALQASAASWRSTYNSIGVPVIWTGVVLAAAGGAALATSIFALPPDEASDASDATAPTSATTSTP
jgi:hypothetical protein